MRNLSKGAARLNFLAAASLLALQAPTTASPAADPKALEMVVITGSRTPTRLADSPQRIELISAEDIERTVSRELSDLLKKNASVDVIQYPGNLSGIGIRGFRPEFSGINKRSLLLVDGRPAMSTNLSLVNMDMVERVEVLKGPASALYGSQAMGGVVNLITRQSRGPLGGMVQASLGTAKVRELRARLGGRLNETLDFDYAASVYSQADFRMGDGQLRPSTAYGQQSHGLRAGLNLGPDWRVSASGEFYRGRDIATPGDLAYGMNQQGNKDMDRHALDLRLNGRVAAHQLGLTLFSGSQWYETRTTSSSNPTQQAYLPFRSFAEDLQWQGVQLQDSWAWGNGRQLVMGVDWERAQADSKSYLPQGPAKAPFSADNSRSALGVYAQNSWQLNQGDTVLTAGLRHDRIEVRTLETPLKTDFEPSVAQFSSTNPSLGFKQQLASGLHLHGTLGQGFVSPSAAELTGTATTQYSNRVEITQGNAALRPESSRSWDLGLAWAWAGLSLDATYFDTRVKDKISRDAGRRLDARTQVFSYVNAAQARMQGLELEGSWRAAAWLRLHAGGTHYLQARQQQGEAWEPINNVPAQTLRLAADLRQGAWSGRLGLRYLGRSHDQDWVQGSGRQVRYEPFAVADVSARWQLSPAQDLNLGVENLFDRFYAEKFGFPQPGRQFKLSYRHEF
ncbi:TonB-dependent receptor [Paucibacter sp. KBW04]|uniref:TonB-dependent receptor plug domain-containing protein n=1 Tax=Paucibacter sp. KBW04 TaxID=2153361 RepID=UPI000F56CB38|nr:TonB-dependent receptor [Paucibacter sp. KBW04]RQO54431.1 TonB-dependent receptor [Paucibacter sp. KBW04]